VRDLVISACAALPLVFGTWGPAAAQSQARDLETTLESLAISLPDSVTREWSVRSALDELSREPCDQNAIANLGDALQKAGRRREAAVAQLSFSKNCDG
jgi:hypothetical protein